MFNLSTVLIGSKKLSVLLVLMLVGVVVATCTVTTAVWLSQVIATYRNAAMIFEAETARTCMLLLLDVVKYIAAALTVLGIVEEVFQRK